MRCGASGIFVEYIYIRERCNSVPAVKSANRQKNDGRAGVIPAPTVKSGRENLTVLPLFLRGILFWEKNTIN